MVARFSVPGQTDLLTYSLHGAESFLRSQNVLSYSRNSPHFMEPDRPFYKMGTALCTGGKAAEAWR
jgi:hypothetical protein